MAEMPNRIRELRIARNWSQDHLADLCHCSKAQISDLERGNRGLDLHWMRRLAKAFAITPAELLSEADNPLLPVGDERDLIERYRDASPDMRENLLRVIQALTPAAGHDKKRKPKAA